MRVEYWLNFKVEVQPEGHVEGNQGHGTGDIDKGVIGAGYETEAERRGEQMQKEVKGVEKN